MDKERVTVKELREALATMPDEAVIEIVIRQYNKVYPHYFYLERTSYNHIAVKPFHDDNGTVRIYSALPETETTYSILSTRKK